MQNSSSVDENNIIHCPSANAWMATIEDSIIAHQLVLTMFYASWSEPSKVMYDMMAQLKKDFPNVVFSKIDIGEVQIEGEVYMIKEPEGSMKETTKVKNVELFEIAPIGVDYTVISITMEQEAVKMMGVRIVPTILFVQEGKEMTRVKLSVTPEVFKQKILSFLQPQES